jgi:hypothetical protein
MKPRRMRLHTIKNRVELEAQEVVKRHGPNLVKDAAVGVKNALLRRRR